MIFLLKQDTADELRISSWSSDVCSSDLLVTPTTGIGFDPLPIPGGDPLTVSLDHGTATTQYSDPFSIISFTQDGFPSGRLDSVTVDSDGVVRASFTNGETQALGKVAVASFANLNGQIGKEAGGGR